MRTLVHLRVSDARRVPWKNGRGVTEELLVRPEGTSLERGDFDVRVSKALVPEPGPFSPFRGFDRVLVVTGGEGLALTHGPGTPGARVLPFEPYAFSGDLDTSATLLGGPVSDFNVIVRRGRRRAEVFVVRPGPDTVPTLLCDGSAFLHVLEAPLDLALRGDGRSLRLRPGESLFMPEARAADALRLAGAGAVAIVARLSPVSA